MKRSTWALASRALAHVASVALREAVDDAEAVDACIVAAAHATLVVHLARVCDAIAPATRETHGTPQWETQDLPRACCNVERTT